MKYLIFLIIISLLFSGISCQFDKDFCNLEVTGMDKFKFAIERGTNFDNINDGPTLDHNEDPQECDIYFFLLLNKDT